MPRTAPLAPLAVPPGRIGGVLGLYQGHGLTVLRSYAQHFEHTLLGRVGVPNSIPIPSLPHPTHCPRSGSGALGPGVALAMVNMAYLRPTHGEHLHSGVTLM